MSDVFFFFKQKTAYEMRISDWSSDVCSSDLIAATNLYTGLKDRERTKILNITETSLSILKHYEAEAAAGKMPKDQAQQAAFTAIRNMRFAGTEYMFAYTFDGVNVIHGEIGRAHV